MTIKFSIDRKYWVTELIQLIQIGDIPCRIASIVANTIESMENLKEFKSVGLEYNVYVKSVAESYSITAERRNRE